MTALLCSVQELFDQGTDLTFFPARSTAECQQSS